MRPRRKLTLQRFPLSELAPDQMRGVAAGDEPLVTRITCGTGCLTLCATCGFSCMDTCPTFAPPC